MSSKNSYLDVVTVRLCITNRNIGTSLLLVSFMTTAIWRPYRQLITYKASELYV